MGQTAWEMNQPLGKWIVYEHILRIPYYFVFNRYTNELKGLNVETLAIYYPDGSPFLTTVELKQRADNAESELKKLRYYLKQ